MQAKPYYINNCFRKAHFLAQVSVETDKFRTLEEYASGNHYNPGEHRAAIDNGNTQMGDGPKYKGRGCIHLTWKNTYAAYGKYVHEDLIRNYWKVAADLHLAVDSAGWFWKIFKSEDLNSLADSLKTDKITKIIVGNTGTENIMRRRSITFQLIKDFNGMNCVNMKK